jgi:hypothetical protein
VNQGANLSAFAFQFTCYIFCCLWQRVKANREGAEDAKEREGFFTTYTCYFWFFVFSAFTFRFSLLAFCLSLQCSHCGREGFCLAAK